MLHRLIALLVIILLGQTAHAGPWLREKGTSFMAVSFASTYYLDTASQTYLEYGLTEKTTIIADIGMIRPRYALQGGIATFSLRRALNAPDAPSKWAYEVGFGAAWIGDQVLPHLRTGLSWGRGLTWGDTSGWTSIDAAVIWDLTYAEHVTKIDATLGANLTDITTAMLQLYTLHSDSTRIATLAPALVFKPTHSRFRIKLGTESEIGALDNTAFKLELWREF